MQFLLLVPEWASLPVHRTAMHCYYKHLCSPEASHPIPVPAGPRPWPLQNRDVTSCATVTLSGICPLPLPVQFQLGALYWREGTEPGSRRRGMQRERRREAVPICSQCTPLFNLHSVHMPRSCLHPHSLGHICTGAMTPDPASCSSPGTPQLQLLTSQLCLMSRKELKFKCVPKETVLSSLAQQPHGFL